jgi:hypothetical protein
MKGSKAYQLISTYYGDQQALRSGVPLMNHILEGLSVMDGLGASIAAMHAYCLHPILQADEALAEAAQQDFSEIDPWVLILAMEYRKTANAYLSKRQIKSISEIELSPLKEVNDMLIADKVQNRKDFELYHKGTHPRSEELEQYFKNWLERLEVSETDYQHYLSLMSSISAD